MAKLRNGNGVARYFEFLIDSGADYTLISQADGLILGVEYNTLSGEEIRVEIANLTFIHAKKTSLVLTVENYDFIIPVLVAKEDVECLLDRAGVFEKFDILFQENKQQVIFQMK